MKIETFNKLILRTPVGAINKLDLISDIKNIEQDGLQFVSKTFDGHFKVALLYASKDLYYEITKSLGEGILSAKVFNSYLKYYIRYCSRSTPFGLFSTYGICEIIDSPQPVNVEIEESCVKVRINLSYIYSLCVSISSSRNLWKYSFLISNKTIYPNLDEIRYNELYIEKWVNNFRLASADKNEILNYILAASLTGIFYDDLCKAIEAEGYDKEEVQEYLDELIQNNVLLVDIFPSPASNNYIDIFLVKLRQMRPNNEVISLEGALLTIKELIVKIETLNDEVLTDIVESDLKSLKELEFQINEKPLELDIISYKNGKAAINTKTIFNIKETLKHLHNLNSNESSKRNETSLSNFVSEYKDKFGEVELPLLFVIDPELGIFNDRDNSISSTLLEQMVFFQNNSEKEYTFKKIDELLFNKYQDALQFNKEEIIITKEECLNFENKSTIPFNQTLNCNLNFFKDEKGDLNVAINGAYGSSAINNMGRFSFGSDEIMKVIQQILEAESSNLGDLIEYAEIVDLPNSKHGNLVVRENQILNEILINVTTASKSNKVAVHLKDLNVIIKNDKVFLRNKVSNKILIPRLSNAHNYQMGNLSHIYRFLTTVQTQFDNSISFSWGFIESFANYTPRVRIDRVIVKDATWNFKTDDLLFLKNKNVASRIIEFRTFIKKWNIPTKVYLVEGDNKLFFDFNSEIFIDLFITMLMKKSSVIIIECTTDKSSSVVVDKNNNSYHSELILPIILLSDNNIRYFESENSENIVNFSPLSECFYINLFTGEQQMDAIIINDLSQLNTKLYDKKLIKNFFYLRYNEKGNHLRIRYFISSTLVYNEIYSLLREFFEDYIKNKIIKKFEISTYQREIGRYSYAGLEFTEIHFGRESNLTIQILNILQEQDFQERWLVGILYIDHLLNKFSYNLKEKQQLFSYLSSQFNTEFNSNKHMTKIIAAKYKTYEYSILSVINRKDPELEKIYNIFDFYFSSFQSDIFSEKNNIEGRDNYIGSLIHMFLNRLLVSQHRKQELIIYAFLLKYYNTQINQKHT